MEDTTFTHDTKPSRVHQLIYIVFVILIGMVVVYFLTSAPTSSRSMSNRQGVLIHVAPGESLRSITLDLETKHVVRQALIVRILVTVFNASRSISRGDYYFKENANAWNVSWMLARGHHGIDPIRITIKEGSTNEEIATILSTKLTMFRKDLFLSNSKARQGYLFPDTYFFFPLTTTDEVIDQLSSNFNNHIQLLKTRIDNSGHDMSEIITMASLVQNEAHGESDAPLVAGILWNRIKKGMPLQVDVSRETYNHTGLPELPISNPGSIAIEATLMPTDSNYLYYLHDKDGMIHTARTYDEHKTNINKYLK